MLKVSVSGSYYTEGSQGKENTNYDFTKEIPDIPENWILALIKSRFLPIWVSEARKANKNAWKIFDGVKSCYLAESVEIAKDDGLKDKDIFEMTEVELQNVAAKYLLTEVPLPFTVPIKELRNSVALNYLKLYKGIKVNSNEDRERLAFFKRNISGEWLLDFGEEAFILEEMIHKEESFDKPIVKQTLSEILKTNSSSKPKLQTAILTEEELSEL